MPLDQVIETRLECRAEKRGAVPRNIRFRNRRTVPENRSADIAGILELSLAARFISQEESFKAYSMNNDLSNNGVRLRQRSRTPAACALAIAAFGLLSMLIVDHGPWNRPHVQTAEAHYATTGAAARAAGATVTPTMPKPALEPVAPVPKPVQPANPATP
jgi:hypothetical protein